MISQVSVNIHHVITVIQQTSLSLSLSKITTLIKCLNSSIPSCFADLISSWSVLSFCSRNLTWTVVILIYLLLYFRLVPRKIKRLFKKCSNNNIMELLCTVDEKDIVSQFRKSEIWLAHIQRLLFLSRKKL